MKKLAVAALATITLTVSLSAAPSRNSAPGSIFAQIVRFVRVHILDTIDPSLPKP